MSSTISSAASNSRRNWSFHRSGRRLGAVLIFGGFVGHFLWDGEGDEELLHDVEGDGAGMRAFRVEVDQEGQRRIGQRIAVKKPPPVSRVSGFDLFESARDGLESDRIGLRTRLFDFR